VWTDGKLQRCLAALVAGCGLDNAEATVVVRFDPAQQVTCRASDTIHEHETVAEVSQPCTSSDAVTTLSLGYELEIPLRLDRRAFTQVELRSSGQVVTGSSAGSYVEPRERVAMEITTESGVAEFDFAVSKNGTPVDCRTADLAAIALEIDGSYDSSDTQSATMTIACGAHGSIGLRTMTDYTILAIGVDEAGAPVASGLGHALIDHGNGRVTRV
jgi:hypothetical protein